MVQITAEIRETDPVEGWRTYESTGNATVTCSCGARAAGPTRAVAHVYRAHVACSG